MHLDLETIKGFIESWGYIIIFLGIAIESTGIPFPGETILLVGAATAASSTRLHIEWVIFWAAAGAIAGDNCGYFAGRKLGGFILEKLAPKLHFDAKKQAYLERYFEKHGPKTIFIGRFIALLRAWAAFFAGMHHMRYPVFLTYNALGGIVWAIMVGLLGFVFGQNLPLLEKYLGWFGYVLLGLVILGGAAYLIYRRRRFEKQL